MQNCFRFTILAFLLTLSPAVFALGLGEAEVRSFLNQPLEVRIRLLSQSEQELSSVTVELASASDHELVGLSRAALNVPLQFDVGESGDSAYITMTSTLPVREPVLQVLVEVNWSGGRMLREYTLFLDPPTFESVAPAPVSAPASAPEPVQETESPPVMTGPLTASEPLAERPAVVAEPEARPVAQPAPVTSNEQGSTEYGPVKNGETLWGIASDWARGSGYSINQAMIAIQRENPNAFIRGNINSLKRGAILRLPDTAVMGDLSVREAIQETARQEEEFRGRRAAPVEAPEAPALADVAVETEPPPMADPAPVAVTEPEVIVEPESPQTGLEEPATESAESDMGLVAEEDIGGHLELVPPVEGDLDPSAGGGELTEDQELLNETLSSARVEEELVNAQQENAYLNERIRELEQQVQDAAASAALADRELAEMEASLRESRRASQAESDPWYSNWLLWLGGLLILIVALVTWFFRRGGDQGDLAETVAADDSVQAIREEAEELLDTLDSAAVDEPEEATVVQAVTDEPPQTEPDSEEETVLMAEPVAEEPGPEDELPTVISPRKAEPMEDSDAEDADTNDPEIKLDLARAYLSMGDREASRAMLEEVLEVGTAEQQAEARTMLDEF
jgi:pilus assembly protein FimV